MAAVLAAPPRNERLRSVRLPALVIHGDADPLIPLIRRRGHGARAFLAPNSWSSRAWRTISASRWSRSISKAIGDFVAKVEAEGEAKA